MQCPTCSKRLATVQRHGVEVEYCSACRGVWLDRAELPTFLRAAGDSDRPGVKALLHRLASLKEGFCPKCNQRALPTAIGVSGLTVLKCVNCKGVWVQTDNLPSLAAWFRRARTWERLVLIEPSAQPDGFSMDGGLVPAALGLVFDENPCLRFPWATWSLIALNAALFLWAFLSPELAIRFMFVPQKFLGDPLRGFPTLLSAMFLHGSGWHIAGNMYFLYIFGDNVEERIGTARYVLFYLACGIVAGVFYALLTSQPAEPALGASGAISGVLGAYLVLYPGVRIRIHRLVGFVSITWRLPVWFYVGIWFLGLQLLGIALRVPGVGWHAHLGGFLFGLLVMLFLRKSNLL